MRLTHLLSNISWWLFFYRIYISFIKKLWSSYIIFSLVIFSYKSDKLLKFDFASRVGSKTEQHRREVRLYAKDSWLWLGEDRRHHIHDDALCRNAILSSARGEPNFSREM